ncbi:MAG: Cadmium-translocating P-type ATPase [Parcubacteria group bacterium GW2011_GWA1_47_8]|nr:MAG: Cadmium-translocating P-type ATPase [Parcubacteria group bacterium GW2011_GWA1_47_8]
MPKDKADTLFKKILYREISLLVIFSVTLIAYETKLVPETSEAIILSGIAILGIIPILLSAWKSILQKRINVDLLATIALVFSLLAGEWVSVLFINLMLTLARVLGIFAKKRVHASLESLAKMKPSRARVMRGKDAVEIPLNEVAVGDLVIVNLGEQIPVDGTAVKGSATVDQSSLTGESLPTLKESGDEVFSATIIASGNLVIRAQKIGKATTFERMITLVENSRSIKTRMETTADKFASWYIGIVLVAALAIYLVTKNEAMILAFVLVVCADDIAVAIPLAYIASMGAAARRGIIIKGTSFLENAAKITTLIVDKTGTLTTGKLSVKHVRSWGDVTVSHAIKLSGLLCHGSTHPVAQAIARYAAENNIACITPDHFEEKEGRGLRGVTHDKEIIVGRAEFMDEYNVAITDNITLAIIEEERRGHNVTLVAYDKQIVGLFALADTLRPHVAQTIATLKESGVRDIVMLTGDNEVVARGIARAAGITDYQANLLPEHKVSALEAYLGPDKIVAMVGDGVNDAAVLARADIGIAMGSIGSDAAIESADIVLMKDNLSKLVELRAIARQVLSVARGNFAIWGVVNIIGIYLVFTGVINAPQAAAYNFLTDFIPIINSLRLFNSGRKEI